MLKPRRVQGRWSFLLQVCFNLLFYGCYCFFSYILCLVVAIVTTVACTILDRCKAFIVLDKLKSTLKAQGFVTKNKRKVSFVVNHARFKSVLLNNLVADMMSMYLLLGDEPDIVDGEESEMIAVLINLLTGKDPGQFHDTTDSRITHVETLDVYFGINLKKPEIDNVSGVCPLVSLLGFTSSCS